MKTIFKIFVILCLMTNSLVFAQQKLTNVQERYFYLDALRTVELYEDIATLDNELKQQKFSKLFTNAATTHIYNDLLGISGAPQLLVNDYIELYSTKIDETTTKVLLKNIRIQSPYYKEGKWMIDVSFDKSIGYMNKCEVLFDSEEHYRADHHIEASLVWSEQNRTCKFASLKGSIASDAKPYPDPYIIITHKKDSRDFDVLYRVIGTSQFKKLEFNSVNQMFLPENVEFTYPLDDDVSVLSVAALTDGLQECQEMKKLVYKEIRQRIRPHVSITLGDSYSMDADKKISVKQSSMEYGLDYGYAFKPINAMKPSLFIGLGLSTSQMDFACEGMTYKYNASGYADISGQSYERCYDLSELSNSISLMDAFVPIYLDLDFKANDYIGIYMDLGVKAYLNLNSKISDLKGKYSVYGVYQWEDGSYDELREGSHWGANGPINGFKDNYGGTLDNNNLSASDIKTNFFSLDYMAGLGFRVKFGKTRWMLDIGATYQGSIINPIENGNSIDANGGNIYENSALVTYTTDGGEKVRSLSDMISSMGRKSLKLNVGLIYKF